MIIFPSHLIYESVGPTIIQFPRGCLLLMQVMLCGAREGVETTIFFLLQV